MDTLFLLTLLGANQLALKFRSDTVPVCSVNWGFEVDGIPPSAGDFGESMQAASISLEDIRRMDDQILAIHLLLTGGQVCESGTLRIIDESTVDQRELLSCGLHTTAGVYWLCQTRFLLLTT